MSVLLTPAEFASDSYMQSTGTIPSNAVQVAIDIAEGQVSTALGFPVDDGAPTFLSMSRTETYKWPHTGIPLQLRVPRLQSVTSVSTLHDQGSCDCTWTTLTDACAYILDARSSLIYVRQCGRESSCYCTRCARGCSPHRVQVTYVAGFTAAEVAATTETGRRLRLAIALTAREIINLQDFWTEGAAPVKSFGSLGYNESRELNITALGNSLGKGWLPQHAANLLEPLLVETTEQVIVLRSQ